MFLGLPIKIVGFKSASRKRVESAAIACTGFKRASRFQCLMINALIGQMDFTPRVAGCITFPRAVTNTPLFVSTQSRNVRFSAR
jgi:hypothetical protein